MADENFETSSPKQQQRPAKFSKFTRTLFYISTTIAALTYIVNNATEFVEKIPRLKRSISYAAFGPEIQFKPIRSTSGSVKDGGRGSQWKHASVCLSPQNGGKLVIGKSKFVLESRSADQGRAFDTEEKNPNPVSSYCVKISTGTDDSAVDTWITGHVEGVEAIEMAYEMQNVNVKK